MSQDGMKEFFNKAFEEEHIAFDPNNWSKMESMLDQRSGRKGFWYWFSGGMAFVTAAVLYFLLTDAAVALYQPRSAQLEFATMELMEPQTSMAETPQKAEPNQSTNAVSKAPIPHQRTISTEFNAASTEEAITTSQVLTAPSLEESVPEVNEPTGSTIPTITTTEAGSLAVQEEEPSAEPLDLMPLRTLLLPTVESSFEDRSVEQLEQNRFPRYYARFGLSHAFMDGGGQIGGIGIDYQFAPKLLVSGELLFARDRTNYSLNASRTYYGFTRHDIEYIVELREMLSAELPVLLSYRMNRLRFGAGVQAGYILSSKVDEFGPELPNGSPMVVRNGFVRWQDLNALQLSIPVDLQFQFDDQYSIGARYSHGLTDAFSETTTMDRKHRIDIYIKMLIR